MQLADFKPTPAEFLGRILEAPSKEVLVYPSGHCDTEEDGSPSAFGGLITTFPPLPTPPNTL